MTTIKKLFTALCSVVALSASAQNDSLYVRMDFNANPWGYAVATPVGTSWSKVDLDNSPEASFLSKNTDFTAKAGDATVTMTVTPTDLDETDYDNCLFYTYDYDVDMSGNTRMNVLRMAIGSTMKFKVSEGYKMAKAQFNTFRNWAHGGLSYTGMTWGPDTTHVYKNLNDKGEVTWEADVWYGDEYNWSTPACTGTTMLRYIDFWVLADGGTGIKDVATEPKAVSVVSANGIVMQGGIKGSGAVANLPKGVYIIDGKKHVVQ